MPIELLLEVRLSVAGPRLTIPVEWAKKQLERK
jgi:hypothetical protein